MRHDEREHDQQRIEEREVGDTHPKHRFSDNCIIPDYSCLYCYIFSFKTQFPAHGKNNDSVAATGTSFLNMRTREKDKNPSSRRRRRVLKSSTVENVQHQANNNRKVDADNDNSEEDHTNRLASLLSHASKHTASASFWKENRSLLDCIARRSGSKTTIEGALLLEEKMSGVLNACKMCTKQAQEESSATKSLACLRVSTHCLRAISTISQETKMQESVIRILYHSIVATSKLCTKKDVACEAGALNLALFHCLGQVLLKYTHSSRDMAIQFIKTEKIHNIFPAPQRSMGTNDKCTLSVLQLFKIVVRSILEVAKSLEVSVSPAALRAWRNELGDDNGDDVVEWMQRNTDYVGLTENLMLETFVPNVKFLVENVERSNELYQDASSYCKAALRVLWEAASKFENSSKSLSIRKKALFVFLLGCSPNTAERTQQFLRECCLNLASSYAGKASASFVHQSKMAIPVGKGDLFDFHKVVGAAIDSTSCEVSIPYAEYSAYRALHIHPELPCGRDCDCVFSSLPCHHGQCLPRASSNNQLGLATLRVILLVQSTYKEHQLMQQSSFDIPKLTYFRNLHDYRSCREEVMETFGQANLQEIGETELQLSSNLLRLLGLPRMTASLINATSQASEAISEPCREALRTVVETILRVNCAIQSATIDEGAGRGWDVMIDLYQRGMVLAENALQFNIQQCFVDILQDSASDVFRLTSSSAAPRESISKIGKVVYSIGSRLYSKVVSP